MDSGSSKTPGTLKLRVVDAAGQTLPCRLHIKQADGSCWLPPDLRDPKYSETEAPDLLLPAHYDRYLHVVHGQDLRSVHLNHGAANLPVPPGKLRIFLARGHEYVPLTDELEVKPGATVTREYVLRRTLDLPAQGWYGGDMHTHFSRWQPSDNHVWGNLLRAEDLHAVNNMVYKQSGIVESPQYAYGPEGEHHLHHAGHHVIASGEEFRDDDLYGHMIAAGLTKVIEPISVGYKLGRRENYPLFASVCDWAHEQGGIAGWAHGGTMIKLFESLPVEAALGKLDCLEIVRNGAVILRVKGKGGEKEIACTERVRVDRSSWLAARARGTVEPKVYGGVAPWNLHAHTSPVYVLRRGQPIREKADLTAMADYIRLITEIYRTRGQFKTDHQREELMANCLKALSWYEQALDSSRCRKN